MVAVARAASEMPRGAMIPQQALEHHCGRKGDLVRARRYELELEPVTADVTNARMSAARSSGEAPASSVGPGKKPVGPSASTNLAGGAAVAAAAAAGSSELAEEGGAARKGKKAGKGTAGVAAPPKPAGERPEQAAAEARATKLRECIKEVVARAHDEARGSCG